MHEELRAHLRARGRVALAPDARPAVLSWTAPTAHGRRLTVVMVAALVAASLLLVLLTNDPGFAALALFGGPALLVLIRVNPRGLFDALHRRSHATLGSAGVDLALALPGGGRRSEHVPWAEYTGVRRRVERWSEETSASETEMFSRRKGARWVKTVAHAAAAIEIVHPDEARAIPVFWGNRTSVSGPGAAPDPTPAPRALWEGWARALDLPALEDGRRREARHLDASVRELVAEGAVEDRWTPDAETPADLSVTRTGEGAAEAFEVTVARRPRRRVDALAWIPIAVGVPIMAGGVALGLHAGAGPGLLLGAAGAVFTATGALPWVQDARTDRAAPTRLVASRREIAQHAGRPRPAGLAGRLALTEIEEVRVVRGRAGGRAVHLIADDGEILTAPMSQAAADWLRDFLVAVIARADDGR